MSRILITHGTHTEIEIVARRFTEAMAKPMADGVGLALRLRDLVKEEAKKDREQLETESGRCLEK